ncbi:MAG: hypothetical protein MI807_00555 [Verrucomicrobiales bacterium]|nr:hypothetical protein [Verrucomicrobiales bacterium]
MKKILLIAAVSALTLGSNAGDWGKAPVPAKAPIEECLDIGGNISVGYHSDYVYHGLRLGRDSVVTDVNYGIDSFIPLTLGATYKNVIGGAPAVDHLELYLRGDLGSFAGFDAAISYTQHFYPEPPLGSAGEIGLHLSRDIGIATLKGNILYNMNYPNSWNITAPDDSGAWFYDFGIEKVVPVAGQNLVLSAGVGYGDNYWGALPLANTTHASGWNHYYITAALPIELNCRATITPYIGYTGAPEGWLVDGIAGPTGIQSDILHGGVTLSVSF